MLMFSSLILKMRKMVEIKPMLLTEIKLAKEDLTKYKGWYVQEKHNGVRSIIHIKNHRIVGVRSRTDKPTLYLYPELKDVIIPEVETGILDSEICVFKNDKSVFYGGIDKRRSRDTARTKELPVKIIVFDVIFWNGQVCLQKPYRERYTLISQIKPQERVEVVVNKEIVEISDLEGFWDMIKQQDREGMVLKNPMAIYELGGRSKQNIKVKNYKQVDVVVESTEQNEKGTKIFGKVVIKGQEIEVEAQIGGKDVPIGSTQTITYLDIYNNRLIQPHKARV